MSGGLGGGWFAWYAWYRETGPGMHGSEVCEVFFLGGNRISPRKYLG